MNKLLSLIAFLLLILVTRYANAQPSAANNGASNPAGNPTDPQIAHIVKSANDVDIDTAKIAKRKTKNEDVKTFAQEMINDHKKSNEQVKDLAKKLHIKAEDNAASKDLEKNGKDWEKELKSKKGDDFDKSYVSHEVQFHEQVLKDIDTLLVPGAKNPELKSLLQQTRGVVEGHLNHARHLETALAK
jgi:putative membrane protein